MVKRWWVVIPSDELLEHLRAAHDGADPSNVLMDIYRGTMPTEGDDDA